MNSPTEQEPSRRQKLASYKEHRRSQRLAERALKDTPLDQAINVGGPKALIDAKDAHETAAAILKDDLSQKPT